MTCTCFAKDYSPTRMIRELKQPRQRRQKEPRNAINFNERDGIVVLLINRRKHIAFFYDLVAQVVSTSLLSIQKSAWPF